MFAVLAVVAVLGLVICLAELDRQRPRPRG